jgi:hypothetical protein
VVPLLRADGFLKVAGQDFVGDLQVAQFGPHDLDAGQLDWALTDQAGQVHRHGSIRFAPMATDKLHDLGMIIIDTGHYRLSAKIGTDADNDWSLWVFARAEAVPLLIETLLTPAMLDEIEAGATIVLSPDPAPIVKTSDLGQTTIFWARFGRKDRHRKRST